MYGVSFYPLPRLWRTMEIFVTVASIIYIYMMSRSPLAHAIVFEIGAPELSTLAIGVMHYTN